MGLTYFKRFLMEVDVSGLLFEPVGLPPGYHLVAWDDSLLEAHAGVKYRCFHEEIDAHVFPSLGDPEGCLRLMRDIAQGDGFLSGATWLLAYTNPFAAERTIAARFKGFAGVGKGKVRCRISASCPSTAGAVWAPCCCKNAWKASAPRASFE